MTTLDRNDSRREAIRRTLEQRAGGTHDAGRVAEATLSIWHQATTRLKPVIGTGGLDALYGRSLQLTATGFSWLSIAVEGEEVTAPLASLRRRLEAHDPVAAAQAGVALLVTVTDLLATLVGESLTERLLGPIWTPPAQASELEIPS
ncbi:MAG: hypothetical protein ABSH53_19735 [Holophaga sp.]|jgi:hypothetical protein